MLSAVPSETETSVINFKFMPDTSIVVELKGVHVETWDSRVFTAFLMWSWLCHDTLVKQQPGSPFSLETLFHVYPLRVPSPNLQVTGACPQPFLTVPVGQQACSQCVQGPVPILSSPLQPARHLLEFTLLFIPVIQEPLLLPVPSPWVQT